MSEQAPERTTTAAGRPPGRRILGMTQTQLLIVLGIALVGGGYLLYRRSKAQQQAAQQQAQGGQCPDGTVPDAQGNCVQVSADFSGQISTLQAEIMQLQSGETGEGAPGAVAAPPAPAPSPSPSPVPGPAVPPGPPSGVRAVAGGSTSIVVTWNKVPGATGYRVRAWHYQTVVGDQHTTGTRATIGGLAPNHRYGAHVAAIGPGGQGGYSPKVYAVTQR